MADNAKNKAIEAKMHHEKANDAYWKRKEKVMGKGYVGQIMHGIGKHSTKSFTPKSRQEESKFKKYFQSENDA